MRLRWVLLVVFFLSGVSALLYQVAWLKYLGFVFGNTVQAAATLIAIFLAGLGIGGYLFGRWGTKARPLLVYAVLEAAIGALGAFSPNAFAWLDRFYVAIYPATVADPGLLALARVAGASLFLLPPTILMGGTLPVLVRWFTGGQEGSGRAVSSLYAANTFGATAGVALSGFFLIPAIGLTATIAVAVALNFFLALGSTALSRAGQDAAAAPAGPAERAVSRAAPVAGWTVVLASALMGLTSIADEVFWSRILVLHLGSSVYAYSLMLFSFLVGLALGSALVYRWIARADLTRLLGLLQLALGAALTIQVHYLMRFSDVLEGFARLLDARTLSGVLFSLLGSSLSALLVPTVLMGATFPVAVTLYARSAGRSESRSVGVIYFFNTVGSITGSLLAGFVLIRLVGSQNGLFLMAAINLGLGVWFVTRSELRGRGLLPAAAALLIAGASFLFARPDGVILSAGLFADDQAEVLLFREDVSATVTLRRLGPENLSLELNGVNVAGTAPDLIGTQKLQGHLPLMLHPDPKSVVHIGFGSGGTAYAVSKHPVEEIRIVEISPEVLEVSGSSLREVNHGVLQDPRVKAEINDGRNFILASPETFDVILSDSIHPRYAGNGSLYTKDYFELCRARLSKDGVISMWLPMYSLTQRNFLEILRAFHDVFPNSSVWYVPNVPNSFTIVIGRLEPGPIPLERIEARLTGPVLEELREIGIEDAADIASMLMMDGPSIGRATEGIAPHVDDLPSVEYESGRLVSRDRTWLANFRILGSAVAPLERAVRAEEGALDEAETQRRARYLDHAAVLERHVRSGRSR